MIRFGPSACRFRSSGQAPWLWGRVAHPSRLSRFLRNITLSLYFNLPFPSRYPQSSWSIFFSFPHTSSSPSPALCLNSPLLLIFRGPPHWVCGVVCPWTGCFPSCLRRCRWSWTFLTPFWLRALWFPCFYTPQWLRDFDWDCWFPWFSPGFIDHRIPSWNWIACLWGWPSPPWSRYPLWDVIFPWGGTPFSGNDSS